MTSPIVLYRQFIGLPKINDFAILRSMINTPLDRLDPVTLHGLVRALMSAYYEDAIDAKACYLHGTHWNSESSRGAELKDAISELANKIEADMESGQLSPFHGDYVKWMEDNKLISHRIEGKNA